MNEPSANQRRSWKLLIYRLARYLSRLFTRLTGLVVHRYRPDYHYCPVVYGSNFAKKVDIRTIDGFRDIAEAVILGGKTSLYYDRLYILYQALLNVRKLSPDSANLAEVGVFRGGSSYFMAAVANQAFEPKPHVYGFDTFAGHSAADITAGLDRNHRPGGFKETSYEAVNAYLSAFDNVTLYEGRFQDTCVHVAERTFAFVHIDVDIYRATPDALVFFGRRMLAGGIIVVDDYGFTTCPGARQAVDEFTVAHPLFHKLHLDTGQCLLTCLVPDNA